ncbi:hypothetical protein L1987_39219 [Smallanthus sonchifolius]|uniref:Uncharacterized protein n=1 Tax=Smallanthus sonchifolius TaxID=185202 RepID=A0ACB9HL73_9ASTR|nr:hypothetical protein L1987_39219 [Smallanthus sonchifolius]
MDLAKMQEEMMKRQQGPSFGFVKLRLGVRRTTDMITDTAMKWSKVARTGGVEVKFMGVDVSTIMFTLEKGQDTLELKEFILSQPEAYEIKIGDQLFRRPGDPSFDDVFAELHANDKNKNDEGQTHPSNDDHKKDELLGISYAKGKGSKQVVISCLVEDDSKAFSESNPGKLRSRSRSSPLAKEDSRMLYGVGRVLVLLGLKKMGKMVKYENLQETETL